MIIVTGAAGFIGSNLVKSLNLRGETDIIAVDNLENGKKFRNLVDCQIMDYIDKREFLQQVKNNEYFASNVRAIFHLGACSSTTEWDGHYIMQNNYEYSKILLNFCRNRRIPFIYASSASVYGSGHVFEEDLQYEAPLNMYGYSKFQFDQNVRRCLGQNSSQIVGFRYFNVYGPREQHKGTMASVAFHCHNQMLDKGEVNLFEGYDGYGNGEQRRDFIYVQDAVDVNLWFLDNPDKSGIFNVGTGRSQTFNDVANSVLDWHKGGKLNYIDFPDHLKGCYQSFTEANISALRAVGYDKPFKTVEQGVQTYLDWLKQTNYDPATL